MKKLATVILLSLFPQLAFAEENAWESFFSKPAQICEALTAQGLKPIKPYHKFDYPPPAYLCATDMFELDVFDAASKTMPNNLALYVEGEQKFANEVKIYLNVNSFSKKQAAAKAQFAATEALFKKFGLKMPSGLESAIISGKAFEADVEGNKITFKSKLTPNGKVEERNVMLIKSGHTDLY